MMSVVKSGDPDHEAMRKDGDRCTAQFAKTAELLSLFYDHDAVMNGVVNAVVNIAFACKVAPEVLRETLCDYASKVDQFYATLEAMKANDTLASAEPQGRA